MTRRFTAGCAPGFRPFWTVYDGFAPMDGETYPNAELAQARADWLNGRTIAKAGA